MMITYNEINAIYYQVYMEEKRVFGLLKRVACKTLGDPGLILCSWAGHHLSIISLETNSLH
jgi:hypothetical protein